MSNPLCINVAAGIFRLVKNGDNAASPSDPANVVFDAFGLPYQGVFLGGSVSTASGFSVTNNALQPQQTSNKTYSLTIGLGKTFAKPPQLLWQCRNPLTGGWSNQYGETTVNPGTSPTTGSALTVFGYATTTTIVVGYTIVNFSSPTTMTPPSNFSYRVFQF